MIVGIVLVISLALNVVAIYAIVRGGRRLFEFDEIFQEILPPLIAYGNDLKEMSSADLDGILVDHPEVLRFHKRNLQARQEIESVIDSVTNIAPPRPKARTPELPKPDME